MKTYIEVHCIPLYDVPGEDNPDARAARAKFLLDQHAYIFQNPEVRLFMLPFRILSPFGDLCFRYTYMLLGPNVSIYVDNV